MAAEAVTSKRPIVGKCGRKEEGGEKAAKWEERPTGQQK